MHHHKCWDDFVTATPSRLVLLTTKGATDLWDFTFQPGDCLVLGQESAGVPDAVHDVIPHRVKVPMPGGGRSLNVAMAAAIAGAEVLRQLR